MKPIKLNENYISKIKTSKNCSRNVAFSKKIVMKPNKVIIQILNIFCLV